MAPVYDAVEARAIESAPRKGSTMSLASLVVLLVAVALAAVAQLVLKHGMTLAQHRVEASGESLAIAAATSPWVVGGLAVGVIQSVVSGYISSSLTEVSSLIVIVLVLLVRPQGLFGAKDYVRV